MIAEAVTHELAELLDSCGMCLLWAVQDEGPYRREAQPVRRDLVEDREGAALQLGLRLTSDGNIPLGDAMVEIWHCDALGGGAVTDERDIDLHLGFVLNGVLDAGTRPSRRRGLRRARQRRPTSGRWCRT